MNKAIKAAIVFVSFLILLVAITPLLVDSPEPAVIDQPAIEVTAVALYAEYEENEIAADARYGDRVLQVSGTIKDMGKDILSDLYVTLETENYGGSVQCMLADSEIAKAVLLTKGSQIVVKGENSGKLGNIVLRDCIIL